jgi:hypothetical protein
MTKKKTQTNPIKQSAKFDFLGDNQVLCSGLLHTLVMSNIQDGSLLL